MMLPIHRGSALSPTTGGACRDKQTKPTGYSTRCGRSGLFHPLAVERVGVLHDLWRGTLDMCTSLVEHYLPVVTHNSL